MNGFLRRGFIEYVRQTDRKKNFARHNRRIFQLFENENIFEMSGSTRNAVDRKEALMLLLAPLVEVAWADGRVTARESDAILQAADSYGLTVHEDSYCSLMATMISRPSPKMTARSWHRFQQLIMKLPAGELETLSESLFEQAYFIAEQSSNNLIGFLRGDGICRDEDTVLQKISEELKKARLARAEREEAARRTAEAFTKEDAKLLTLVPLVKVAWAEGRITRRERRIILDAATRFGIEPQSAAHRKLLHWLELHPADDFYNESLELLSGSWEKLDAQERALRSLEVLSDCALVAEASGGNLNYPAGGERVCEEEIHAMRRIEQKLNGKAPTALAFSAAGASSKNEN
jgi:uncharacterized membrane protein YebE (DUF533 family)